VLELTRRGWYIFVIRITPIVLKTNVDGDTTPVVPCIRHLQNSPETTYDAAGDGSCAVCDVEGGYTAWKQAGLPVVDKPQRKP